MGPPMSFLCKIGFLPLRTLRLACRRGGDGGHLGGEAVPWVLAPELRWDMGGHGLKLSLRLSHVPAAVGSVGFNPRLWSWRASSPKSVVRGFPLACCLTKGESNSCPCPALSTFQHLEGFMQ